MPNVTSETHRKWFFWLLFPLAAAMNFSYLYIRSPNRKTPWKKSPAGRETPCLWRTEKPQNCTPKMPNVTSETDRKWCFWLLFPLAAAMNFGYLFLLLLQRLLLLLLLVLGCENTMENRETPCLWKTEKPQNCTPKMPNVTSETHRKWWFWLLFPLAAAMNFGYLYIRSPNGKTPWKKSPAGRETPCLWRTEKPQNCSPKMPNVTSETHRKWWFWLLFPLAAAMNFGYGKTPWKKSPPGRKTPCLWRTEKPQNCTPKMPNVTSETDRKWWFWLLFPLAAAMNFGYLYIRWKTGKQGNTMLLEYCCCCCWCSWPFKKAAFGKETPCYWRATATAAAAAAAVPTKTRPSRTGKHHGPEGRTESKICVSRGRNVPSEISYKKLAIRFSRLAAGSLLAASLLPLRLLLRLLVSAAAYWCLLLPAACCSLLLPAAGAAAGGCCCCCCAAAKQEAATAAAAAAVPTKTRPSRTGKHHSPEGRTESKII